MHELHFSNYEIRLHFETFTSPSFISIHLILECIWPRLRLSVVWVHVGSLFARILLLHQYRSCYYIIHTNRIHFTNQVLILVHFKKNLRNMNPKEPKL
jgi:hypothetical protein